MSTFSVVLIIVKNLSLLQNNMLYNKYIRLNLRGLYSSQVNIEISKLINRIAKIYYDFKFKKKIIHGFIQKRLSLIPKSVSCLYTSMYRGEGFVGALQYDKRI